MTPKAPFDLPALESWLWEAACVIRGPIDSSRATTTREAVDLAGIA